MSYFDDNEDRIIYGPDRVTRSTRIRHEERIVYGRGRGTYYVPIKGTPAPPGSDLAKARIAAHAAFDPLWQSGRMTRSRAYSELARRLGIPKHLAHMQMFDKATCERVIALFLVDDFETLEDDFSDLL